jgi:S-DNA-T family DNA segregation ATPase FtsK/SpoIIIE
MQLNRIDAGQASSDELFDDAARIVLESQRGSVSLLQRKLSIGYARASRIIEAMAVSGILGQYKGSQAREVLVTLEEYERLRQQMEADRKAGFSDMQDEQQGNDEDKSADTDKTGHPVKEVDYDSASTEEQQSLLNS